jgi:hypothetical protein
MTESPKKRRWPSKRLIFWLATPVILLAALLLGIRASLPSLLIRGATFASQKYLGLPVTIGNIDLSLRSGEILIENLHVGAATGAKAGTPPPLLEVGKVSLRWSWSELWHRRATVTSLAVENPVLRMTREPDGQIDPLRHAKPEAPATTSATPASDAKPWPILIQSFSLRSPKVVVADAPSGKNLLEFSLESFDLDEVSVQGSDLGLGAMAIRGPELRVHRELIQSEAKAVPPTPPAKTAAKSSAKSGLRIREVDVQRAKFTWEGREGPLDVQLTLKVTGITAEENKPFPIDMTLQVGSGKLSLKGDAGILPPFFQGKASWKGLSFPPLLLAVRPELIEWLQSANSSGDLSLMLDTAGAKGPPAFHFSGHTSLDNVSAAAPGDNRVTIGWKRLDLDIRKGVLPLQVEGKPPRPIVTDFDRIYVEAPWVVYTHPASFLKLLEGGDGSTPIELSISQLDLNQGDIKLHDTSVSSTAAISQLSVSLSDMRYPESTFGWLSMQAMLPTTSRFTLEGSLKAGWIGDFSMSVQDLDLPPWNPYAKSFGVSLDAGTVSLQTKLGLNGAVIKADNEIVLSKLGLSLLNPNSFAREFGVPIDLVLALLRDPSGNIRLTIPVLMDEKGTSVSKQQVAGSAVKAAVLGALSSPLKLLGAGVDIVTPKGAKSKLPPGSEPTLIPPIKSVAGKADAESGAAARLRGIVKLLAERPEIEFVLSGQTSPADIPVLADQILVEQAKADQKLPHVSDAGFLARRRIGIYLDKRSKGEEAKLDEKDMELFSRFVAAVEVPQARLDALAKDRAEKVKALLTAKGVAPARLSIGERKVGSEPGVVMDFKLSQPGAKTPTKPRQARSQ